MNIKRLIHRFLGHFTRYFLKKSVKIYVMYTYCNIRWTIYKELKNSFNLSCGPQYWVPLLEEGGAVYCYWSEPPSTYMFIGRYFATIFPILFHLLNFWFYFNLPHPQTLDFDIDICIVSFNTIIIPIDGWSFLSNIFNTDKAV